MSSDQDKYARSEFPPAPISLEGDKFSFISDSYTESEATKELGTHIPSWECEVGRRLEFATRLLGKDKSVRLLGRSWKQLQRYFSGKEVPASIISAIARATNLSVMYVLEGTISTSGDAELERKIIDRKLYFVDMEMDKNDPRGSAVLSRKYQGFLEISQNLVPIIAKLSNKEGGINDGAFAEVDNHYDNDTPSLSREFATIIPQGRDEIRGIPIYDATLSLGPGLNNGDTHPIGILDLPDDYLRDVLRCRPGKGVAVYMRGDSMAPALMDNDLAIINTAVQIVERDDIYAFSLDGEGYIKRLQKAGSEIIVHSDNPSYSDWTISGRQLQELRVIGRIVGSIRKNT